MSVRSAIHNAVQLLFFVSMCVMKSDRELRGGVRQVGRVRKIVFFPQVNQCPKPTNLWQHESLALGKCFLWRIRKNQLWCLSVFGGMSQLVLYPHIFLTMHAVSTVDHYNWPLSKCLGECCILVLISWLTFLSCLCCRLNVWFLSL